MRRRDDLAFPMVEYDRRLADLRDRMATAGIDAMLTTTPENICYLTGFDSPGHYWFQGLVVPLDGEPFGYSRLLETSGVEADTWIERNIGYHDSDDIITGLAGQLLADGYGDATLAIERECWFFPATFQERLFNAMPDTTFVDASGIVEAGRLIKSTYEIDLIKRAAAMGDRAIQAGLSAWPSAPARTTWQRRSCRSSSSPAVTGPRSCRSWPLASAARSAMPPGRVANYAAATPCS